MSSTAVGGEVCPNIAVYQARNYQLAAATRANDTEGHRAGRGASASVRRVRKDEPVRSLVAVRGHFLDYRRAGAYFDIGRSNIVANDIDVL